MLRVFSRVANIPDDLYDWLSVRGQVFEKDDGRVYVDGGIPRDADITDEIREHTVGYAVVDSDTNAVLGEWRDLKKAEAAVAGAKIVLSVDFDGIPESDEEPAKRAK